MTFEDHEKKANDTFHELNKIPSLLREFSPRPSPSRKLQLRTHHVAHRRPRPGAQILTRPPRSPTVAFTEARKPLLRPLSLPPCRHAHPPIDSHVTQWSEKKALEASPLCTLYQ